MEADLIKMGVSQGLGYGLFIFLLLYVLRANDDREQRYQTLLESTIDQLKIVETIQCDVKDIKAQIIGGLR